MSEKILVETLSFKEVSKLFYESFDKAFPKTKRYFENAKRKLRKAKIKNHKWIKTYEEFPGVKINFYSEINENFDEDDVKVSIGMTFRTKKGLILVTFDSSNGGVPIYNIHMPNRWDNWVRIYTGHFCERYAERIMKIDNPTFNDGSEGLMFSDLLGPVRIIENKSETIQEIAFQFKDGQAFGFRDLDSKVCLLRTVYSNHMLKKDKLEFKDQYEDSFEQYYELFGIKI